MVNFGFIGIFYYLDNRTPTVTVTSIFSTVFSTTAHHSVGDCVITIFLLAVVVVQVSDLDVHEIIRHATRLISFQTISHNSHFVIIYWEVLTGVHHKFDFALVKVFDRSVEFAQSEIVVNTAFGTLAIHWID